MFSTAYGNVGSSIYYALGVTALYAGGMTPVTFAISGVIFAFTAATYAEATARFPEAGGSASFSRRAFNEAVSFFAAWAQMLNYTVTIAISAYTVPPYLSVFPGCSFMRNGMTGQVVVAAGLCIVLALLNIRGIQESARLNIFLAIADLATQALLVIVGVALILDPQVLVGNVHFGTTPTVSAFLISIPIGMVAYTGIETISNMAEEARDPARDVPRSIGLVAAAVFAIYAFLPAVALSAMPVHETPALSSPPGTEGTHFTTALGAKYAGDPVQGIVQNLGLGPLTTPVSYYVGLLAGTILIIATNAGLIGVSRLTYSMGVHRQFPDFLRTVHPTWRTPWVAIVIYTFAAIGMIGAAKVAGGQGVAFLGNLYAFGAMLSFTIAHASVIALRLRRSKRDPEQPFRAPLNMRVGEWDIPVFAVLGGIGTFLAFLVVAVQGTLERGPSPLFVGPNQMRDRLLQWSKDVQRSIDYLETRPEIDTTKLAFYGISYSAGISPTLLAPESRFKTAVLVSGGAWPATAAEVDPWNYAPRVKVPVLMLNGRDDFVFPVDRSQLPLLNALGAAAKDKRHVLYDGGHVNLQTRMDLIGEILRWLDRYLGPVNTTP